MTTIFQDRMRRAKLTAAESEARINEIFADSFPMVLESTCARLVSGDNRQINHDEIQNPYVNAFLVHEIRFRLMTRSWRAYGSNPANMGGSIAVQFNVGGSALSRVPIPVAMFGPPIPSLEHDDWPVDNDVDTSWDAEDRTYVGPNRFGQPEPVHVGHFRWRLPRPLLLTPGTVLDARVYRSQDGFNMFPPDPGGDDSDPSVDVSIAYAGLVARQPIPPGLIVPIPYVALWKNDFASGTPRVVQSGQQDLYNPFPVPLRLQRLMARMQSIVQIGAANTRQVSLDIDIGRRQPLYFPPTSIKTFNDFSVTRETIPGVSVFEGYQRGINMPIDLAPGGGFTVQVDASTGLPSVGTGGLMSSFVSMIGYREEHL